MLPDAGAKERIEPFIFIAIIFHRVIERRPRIMNGRKSSPRAPELIEALLVYFPVDDVGIVPSGRGREDKIA